MVDQNEYKIRAQEIINAGRYIDSKGWVPATSGNFSTRLSDGTIAITVSGTHKGRLTEDDIMLIDSQGRALDDQKPSAETRLHTAIYQRFIDINAVLHPHTLNSTLISRLFHHEIVLKGYELLKAFTSINTHETELKVPIFDNDQNIDRLSNIVDRYMNDNSKVQAYIISSHGFYTWGHNINDALRHVEALEFLFDCEIRLSGAKRS